ncbi:Ig-like domain-containing protein [Microbacterium sp. BWT-B31]|uniref:Ig-like domain-containing protein n=1 Tax=Microbacterium sp. BWT-B31 TaxID=3232072 RepID=UPI0035288D0C
MKASSWLRARPRALASTGIVTVAAAVIATMAVVSEGFPTTEVDLHDGGVWVTKQSGLLVGHFNHESTVLDAGLRTATKDYDILQSGTNVFVLDAEASSVTRIDPAMVVLGETAHLPNGAKTVLGGSTLAILDRTKGALWVVPARGLGGFEVATDAPVAKLGAGADAAVGLDGTVYAVSPADGEVVTIPVDAEGAPGEASRSKLDGLSSSSKATITAVGSTAVVLDGADNTLYSTGGLRASIPGSTGTAVLQQPGAATDSVTVATAGALLRVPLDGSEPVEVSAGPQGVPTAPVYLGGCAYGAWSGSLRFVRDCLGEGDDLAVDVPGAKDDAELAFRVNRDVIVLNDVVGGSAWTASDTLQQVDNWDDITPPEGETEQNDEETVEETVETTLPERSEINTPPVATDDEFGVRPGRTTLLPVLDNDSDADGDVLTVSLSDGQPSLGEVQVIDNGAGFQIAVPEGATGSASFPYQVDDGRQGTATASVTVSVHDWDRNAAPKQKRVTALTVESGGVLTYNVLPDWIDPDGDDVVLTSVEPAPGDEVDITPDGGITYRAIGGALGRVDVKVFVSDGTEITEGVLRLDVRPVGSTLPIANADHVVVRAGKTVTVSPLLNDTNASREPLRLSRVDEVAGATISPDFANSTFTFSSTAVGVYYVQYLVSAGVPTAAGVVRVDVIGDEIDPDAAPIAVRDIALLPSGRETLVNVLANDTDPAGGILVVQSVQVDPGSGISVSVLGHETLRVSDQGALSEQVTIRYTISNGRSSAEGEVVVIPIPAPSKLLPPVANDDEVVVRAGDIVTIPVLANDYHPNGDTIHVAPQLVAPLPDAEDGEIFVSQDTVRFHASDQPGTVYATYEAVDSTGQKDAAYLTIQVLPVNLETNQAPRPRDLTTRVLAGSTVTVSVPLDGIDADGDSVELLGIASAPGKGRIDEITASTITYRADASASGLDEFTYRVRDHLGKEATATIQVGIAPPGESNQAPYAVKDSVVMRPGRTVAVPVLANDSDPEGDQLSLLKNGLILPDVPGLKATVLGDRVLVTAPDSPMQTSLQYTISDARGARSVAVIQVSVDEDVPLLAPIARDDRVLAHDVEEDTVDLEILANDEDPDGTIDALKVEVFGDKAKLLADKRLRITLDDEERLLTYTITDEDGLTATAFVRVPALADLPPTLASTKPIEVVSGETIEIPLADHVRAAGGNPVVITEAAKVVAAHSNGANLVKDQKTLVYTSAERYFGQDAITFEVTDGTGPDDPEGRKATLTIPITVLPPANQQPTFLNGQVSVAPGEDATTLDLRPLTTDPDPGDVAKMTYTLIGGAPAGLTASVSGSILSVGAASNTPKDTQATLKVRIDDGETEPIEGTILVTVTASTRSLPTATDDVVDEAHQGKTVTVDVLANDFNPFPETPLKVVGAVTETGEGTAEVKGDKVEVSPGKTFFGSMVVRYRIQDATADVDREVEGRILVTVQGRPDAPGKPTVSSVQDRTVVLSWTPPADNGAEITSYTVSSVNGDYTKECAATTCTLDKLTNNVEYNFTVIATNRVADSDPSPPSETARPDARPDTPNPPTFTAFGDKSLSIAWVTPTTPGSPVEKFTLEISPAPPSGISQKADLTGNDYVWTGLENGVAYRVRVMAHNRAPEPSSWSGWSATEVPAKAPEPVASPSVARLDPVGAQAQLEVSWDEPMTNGAAITGYELQVMQGSTVVRTIPGIAPTQHTQAVVVGTSTTDYTFRVRASNKAGWGEWGATSAPRRAFVAPGEPTVTSVQPGDHQLTVGFTKAAGNGANDTELRYEYSLNGGGWAAFNGSTITGLTNGTDYSVRLRAYTSMDGVRYDGAASAAFAAQKPYGPVNTPGAGATNNGTSVTVSWSVPAANGRPIARIETNIDGGGWQNRGASGGSAVVGDGYQQTHSIQVRAIDTEGQTSAVASASARTNDPPQPTARTTKGGSAQGQSGCGSQYCAYLAVTVQDFPEGSYSVRCNDSADGPNNWRTVSLPRNGTVELTCYFGYPGQQAWVDIQGWGEAQRLTW